MIKIFDFSKIGNFSLKITARFRIVFFYFEIVHSRFEIVHFYFEIVHFCFETVHFCFEIVHLSYGIVHLSFEILNFSLDFVHCRSEIVQFLWKSYILFSIVHFRTHFYLAQNVQSRVHWKINKPTVNHQKEKDLSHVRRMDGAQIQRMIANVKLLVHHQRSNFPILQKVFFME